MTAPLITTAANGEVPPRPGNCPLRIGSDEEFAKVREFLTRHGFTESAMCKALELPSIVDLPRVDWERTPLDHLAPELRQFLSLFARVKAAPQAEVEALWGADTAGAFLALGLLQPSRRHAGHVISTVWLSPIQGFVAASDLSIDPDSGDSRAMNDAVFPAIEGVTLEFLNFLPDAHGLDALDMCGGSGIGAMILARTARSAATADVAPRSAYFAAFNARLNGVAIESLCGDLYQPAAGRQFDLITAHPPYVPDIGEHAIYRDGGEAGETITRGVIEGMAQHLRPGGTGLVVCFARDTNKKPYEQRAREWLGDAGKDFDIIFGMDRTQSIEQVVEVQRHRLEGDVAGQLHQLHQRLLDLDTKQFVHGALMLRRKPVSSPPLRLRMTRKAAPRHFDRVFAWRQRRDQPAFMEQLTAMRPRLAKDLELNTRQTVKDGKFTTAEITFHIDQEFEAILRPEIWIQPAIARLDGTRTVMEAFRESHAANELPKEFPIEAFVGLIDLMIERGFLELEETA